MTTLKETICNSIADMLKEECEWLDVDTVVDYEEKTVYGGYCETCRYTEIVVEITYVDTNGNTHVTEYSDSFGGLLDKLSR